MELKTQKDKKISSFTKLVSRGKMFRIPILILFLLGSTSCDDTEEDAFEIQNLKFDSKNGLKVLEHSHRHGRNGSLSDIQYLRRRLNREIVNFVMRDYLVDGEVENRVHFDGITAKETYVGANGSGLRLRQLTDGRHLVQLIYTPNGDVQDCEYITQAKSARNFLKTLRKELKLALDEQSFKLTQHDKSLHEYYRHFSNMTLRVLRNGETLPIDVASWFDFNKLKMECLERHEELRFLMANKNKVSDATLARSRRSLKENFIVPGTKWCGAGDLAEKYNDIGMNRKEDTCCRAHDNCRLNIGAFRRRFGYFNFRPFTISNCACDRRSISPVVLEQIDSKRSLPPSAITGKLRPAQANATHAQFYLHSYFTHRKKRDAMEILRVPGTKWCGKGYSATRYSQLGGYTRTDRCCRVHDLRCPFWIGGMEKKYGLYNWRVNTLMHCRCDERFRACLKLANTSMSNMVGKLFFNVVQTRCFVLKPVKACTQRSWWGRCLRRSYTKRAYLRDNMPY